MIKTLLLIVGVVGFIKFFFFASKYRYRVTVFAGDTGSGKTMLASSKALKLIKRGMPVFSTYYLEGSHLLSCDFYNFNYPENSTLIIDETQIGLDSRDYSNLIKKGTSGRLKNLLSMHRHKKLDIWFITQNVEDIDAQIRRYCNQLFYCKTTLFRRKFCIITKKLNLVTLPYFQYYEVWKDIKTYERYLKGDIKTKTKFYGTRPAFAFISSSVFSRYNTEQMDKASALLPQVKLELHTDPNSFIDTGV